MTDKTISQILGIISDIFGKFRFLELFLSSINTIPAGGKKKLTEKISHKKGTGFLQVYIYKMHTNI